MLCGIIDPHMIKSYTIFHKAELTLTTVYVHLSSLFINLYWLHISTLNFTALFSYPWSNVTLASILQAFEIFAK